MFITTFVVSFLVCCRLEVSSVRAAGYSTMMDIVVPETCRAYKKYNKIISGIELVLVLQLHFC